MTRLSEQQRLALRERFLAAWRGDEESNPSEHEILKEFSTKDESKQIAWRIVLTLAETHPATFQRRRRVKDNE